LGEPRLRLRFLADCNVGRLARWLRALGYDASYHALIQEMISTPADVQRITYLIWTCHNLERIADRVTNICERIIFMVTGQLEEINVSRY